MAARAVVRIVHPVVILDWEFAWDVALDA